MLDSDGNFCKYRNFYVCNHLDSSHGFEPESHWESVWSCMCNDKCPVCNHEVEPYESEDIVIDPDD